MDEARSSIKSCTKGKRAAFIFFDRSMIHMSKKSYKQLQNRLYREIKRRIVAEQAARVPLNLTAYDRKIDILKVKQIITCGEILPDEVVKRL